MYLFKHPKELRPNKDMAGRLINEWSRPIFGQSSNFKSVNREDLQKRDMESVKKRRRRYDNIRVLIGWGCFMVMKTSMAIDCVCFGWVYFQVIKAAS